MAASSTNVQSAADQVSATAVVVLVSLLFVVVVLPAAMEESLGAVVLLLFFCLGLPSFFVALLFHPHRVCGSGVGCVG